jgi:hypothetical protein
VRGTRARTVPALDCYHARLLAAAASGCAAISRRLGVGAVCSDQGLISLGSRVTSYRPMTLADLGGRLARVDDAKTRWKLVWQFLEEYRWEPDDVQPSLLCDEPPATGDE